MNRQFSPRFRHARIFLGVLLLSAAAQPMSAGDKVPPRPSEEQTAAKVDALIQKALGQGALPPLVDDESFLRRATMDLTGLLPDPEEMHRFASDQTEAKRALLVDRLLESEAYALNWGRYWRDVVSYHTPASANYLRWKLYDRWWTEQLKRNRPWDEIVTTLLTANGVNDETAPVNYLTSMYGNPVEIAATTSRVFLGVQLQCAECHDAKTAPWERRQFHEFAAFFGRARLVQHKDVGGRGTPYAIEPRAEGQYRMTDKKDASRRIDMQPRFLTGESVSLDAPDDVRRQTLARFMTRPENPWFAKCYVNRVWTSMMGWGFYPTVADLGSGEEPRYSQVLSFLEKDWIASGHDMHWLFRVIARTRVYQCRLQAASSESTATPAVCPVRLRPEQVFEALRKTLAFDENDKKIPSPALASGPSAPRHEGLRHMVYQSFKVNPSAPQEEIQGTVSQALLMMNSQLVHGRTSAGEKTILGDLLAKELTDEQIVLHLYERALARKPTTEEKAICQHYIAEVGNRKEALEDIFWSLVNSTEFLIKN